MVLLRAQRKSSLINGSDDSDQSAEWEPDEDDQADIELAEMLEAIDPSMMYLLEEGYQPCQIMAMEANRAMWTRLVGTMQFCFVP